MWGATWLIVMKNITARDWNVTRSTTFYCSVKNSATKYCSVERNTSSRCSITKTHLRIATWKADSLNIRKNYGHPPNLLYRQHLTSGFSIRGEQTRSLLMKTNLWWCEFRPSGMTILFLSLSHLIRTIGDLSTFQFILTGVIRSTFFKFHCDPVILVVNRE